MTTTTIQALAEQTRKHFVKVTRDDGAEYWKTTDDRPDWVQEMCHAAHGEMMPDDWRYAFIVEALDALARSDDADDADVEADDKTHELTEWLHSRADRYSYCDDFMEETDSKYMGMVQLLAWGQYQEKREVLDSVRSFLESRLEDEDSDESDDD